VRVSFFGFGVGFDCEDTVFAMQLSCALIHRFWQALAMPWLALEHSGELRHALNLLAQMVSALEAPRGRAVAKSQLPMTRIAARKSKIALCQRATEIVDMVIP
jgi:hypothetical protein